RAASPEKAQAPRAARRGPGRLQQPGLHDPHRAAAQHRRPVLRPNGPNRRAPAVANDSARCQAQRGGRG
nr:hypothetical protein [Tanacetum cinerariifolium]